jgi:hypothetical protein
MDYWALQKIKTEAAIIEPSYEKNFCSVYNDFVMYALGTGSFITFSILRLNHGQQDLEVGQLLILGSDLQNTEFFLPSTIQYHERGYSAGGQETLVLRPAIELLLEVDR